MLVWQASEQKPGWFCPDNLGFYWEALMEYLKSPVKHTLESFLLETDHEKVREFREALRGPPGRVSARGVNLEPYFWNSKTDANLPHNKAVRSKNRIDDLNRFITNWHGFGKKQLPPHYWLEYMACLNQRNLDMIDILHSCFARDAESHDSNFISAYWNHSQNVSKEKHRTAVPGIAGW